MHCTDWAARVASFLMFGRRPTRRAEALVFALVSIVCASSVPTGDLLSAESPVTRVSTEFVFTEAPSAECHASTIEDTPEGLVAAWFGGTEEGDLDVVIWFSRRQGDAWTPAVAVADGVESESKRHPCWNPVLFQVPDGPLLLFYKVGPSPSTWWGMLKRSSDGGATWSAAERLPEGQWGPIKNKPCLLNDGRLLCGSSTEHEGWRVHMEWTQDQGKTWEHTPALNDGRDFGVIQPTILLHGPQRLQILCRGRGTGHVMQSWSEDAGKTWTGFSPIDLPNPNSGIDGVTLSDGRHLLVYNHTPRGRSPLNVAISRDGRAWTPSLVLEDSPGEYSYPAVIQAANGRIHVLYTWKRQRIKHASFDPADLRPNP